MKIVKKLSIISACVALAACSFFSDEVHEKLPAQPKIESSVTLTPLWTHHIGSNSKGRYDKIAPTLAGNDIVIASRQGYLTLLSKETGNVVWRVKSDHSLTGSALVANDKVYVGDSNADIIAIDRKTGKELWRKNLSNEIVGKPAFANHQLIVKTLDGKVTALNDQTGDRLWQYEEGNSQLILKGSSNVIVHGNQVIAGFPDGKLSVIGLKKGDLIWQRQVADPEGFSELQRMVDINATPLVNNNRVYAATYQGNLSAMNLVTGDKEWEHKLSTFSELDSDAHNIYATDDKGNLWAFNKASGVVNWQQNGLARYMLTGTTSYKNYIVVGDNIGNVHLLHKSDGHFVGRQKVSGTPIYDTPLTDGDKLYVYSSDGKISAFKIG